MDLGRQELCTLEELDFFSIHRGLNPSFKNWIMALYITEGLTLGEVEQIVWEQARSQEKLPSFDILLTEVVLSSLRDSLIAHGVKQNEDNESVREDYEKRITYKVGQIDALDSHFYIDNIRMRDMSEIEVAMLSIKNDLRSRNNKDICIHEMALIQMRDSIIASMNQAKTDKHKAPDKEVSYAVLNDTRSASSEVAYHFDENDFANNGIFINGVKVNNNQDIEEAIHKSVAYSYPF